MNILADVTAASGWTGRAVRFIGLVFREDKVKVHIPGRGTGKKADRQAG